MCPLNSFHPLQTKGLLFPTIIKWCLTAFACICLLQINFCTGWHCTALNIYTAYPVPASPIIARECIVLIWAVSQSTLKNYGAGLLSSVSSAMTSMSQNPSECLHQSGSSHTSLWPVAPALWVAAGLRMWLLGLELCHIVNSAPWQVLPTWNVLRILDK